MIDIDKVIVLLEDGDAADMFVVFPITENWVSNIIPTVENWVLSNIKPTIDPRHFIHVANVEKWVKIDGEFTHRLNYDLNADSVVFDVGGYIGDWAASIYCRYNCNILIFEPMFKYYNILKRRFANNKLRSFQIGLGKTTESVQMSDIGDASSSHTGSTNMETVHIFDIVEFMDDLNINKVDLIKLNIEGGEYDLLERLIDTGYINKFKDIQIQFHYWANDTDVRMLNIQHELNKTHKLTYRYEYVWENWTRK